MATRARDCKTNVLNCGERLTVGWLTEPDTVSRLLPVDSPGMALLLGLSCLDPPSSSASRLSSLSGVPSRATGSASSSDAAYSFTTWRHPRNFSQALSKTNQLRDE